MKHKFILAIIIFKKVILRIYFSFLFKIISLINKIELFKL